MTEAAWGRDYVTPQWGTHENGRGIPRDIGGQVAGVTDTHGDSRWVPEAQNRAISTIMPFTGGKS
jgi:hypothetical protein